MFLSEFPQAIDINPCPSSSVCNNGELIDAPGDLLNAGENVEDKYDYGFTDLLRKKLLL